MVLDVNKGVVLVVLYWVFVNVVWKGDKFKLLGIIIYVFNVSKFFLIFKCCDLWVVN